MQLKINNVNKFYGSIKALNDFDMNLKPGIYGLLGANGSGKSTLLNIISQNLKADSGTVELEPAKDILEVLGFMPQQQALYRDMSARAFLHYMAKLKRVKNTQVQVEDLLEAVNLADIAHKKMKGFSGGMKQRVLLAQALLGDPKVLLLDEPTAGLDPVERIRIRNLISSFSTNKIIILATHVVSDIEYISNQVILLKKGNIIGCKPISEWLQDIQDKVFEMQVNEMELEKLQNKYLVGNIFHSVDGVVARVISDERPSNNAKNVNPNLEDVYLYYNEGDLLNI